MNPIDTLINLISENQFDEAILMLNQQPALATAHSEKEGQMQGESPLHRAAHRNAVELCQRLIELGADVNDTATHWWLTPLAWAADAASVEAVELLLQHGAKVDQDAVVGTTALHAAAMGGSSCGSERSEAYAKTAEILIAHGADINHVSQGEDPQTPLDCAITAKNNLMIELLQNHGGQFSGHTLT